MKINDSKLNFIQGWLKQIRDQIIPPFCVELVLSEHSRYYLHSICMTNEATNSAIIRIWDFRAMNDDDIEKMKANLNNIKKRDDLEEEKNVHPKLDWANLRICFQDILFCFEWHDRLWPESERPPIGFATREV